MWFDALTTNGQGSSVYHEREGSGAPTDVDITNPYRERRARFSLQETAKNLYNIRVSSANRGVAPILPER